MKIDVIKTPPFVNRWVIDERGFKKLAGKPINNAQTACSSVSGQGCNNGLKVVAQPISPSIK